MRRIFLLLASILFLSGCSNDSIEPALELRQKLQNGSGCEFDAIITADYSEEVYEFTMHCKASDTGELHFEVKEPDTIAGICGYIDEDGGHLTFDDQVLAFELMADDQISPVSTPWILVKALLGGYIKAGGTVESGTKLIINDTYSDDAFQVDIWLDHNDLPSFSEILWNGRRILSIQVVEFQVL